MRKVNIKGQPYSVTRKRVKGLDGLCNLSQRRITVCPRVSREEFFMVLIHEMIHGCIREVGVDVHHQLEEVICESVSTMIHQNFEIQWKKKTRSGKK